MECRKCHVNISNTDKYCPRCGELFDNGDVERLGNTIENYLLNIYTNKVGRSMNFSLGYLLFNFWYALYRKMYYEAIIGAAADGILINLIFSWQILLFDSKGFNALLIIFLFALSIFINIYYILKFDELYLIRAKGYIAKIIRNYGTNDVKVLTRLCKKDSRGNLFIVILPMILFSGVFVYLLFIH